MLKKRKVYVPEEDTISPRVRCHTSGIVMTQLEEKDILDIMDLYYNWTD